MNNIQSPDNTDPGIERSIQAKGVNAPRVTPDALQENIVSAHYFTAAQGCIGNAEESPSDRALASMDLITFCVLILRNGFKVTGESACASPEHFDADIGKRIARANAEQKIWPLMGYVLKEQLSQNFYD